MRNPTDMATGGKHFSAICESFEVLSNPQFKAIYDAYGEVVLKQGFAPEDKRDLHGVQYRWKGSADKIFNDFFGAENPFKAEFKQDGSDMYGSMFNDHIKSKEEVEAKPEDVTVDIHVNMSEAFHGCTKQVTYTQ